MNTLFIMCGPPGCGKSTFIEKFYGYDATYTKHPAICSRDQIRFNLLKEGEDYFAHEDEVIAKYYATLGSTLEYEDIIADSTNLTPKARRKLINGVKEYCKEFNIVFLFFNKEYCKDVCIKFNNNRTGLAHVPEAQIENMIKAYVEPTKEECIKYDAESYVIDASFAMKQEKIRVWRGYENE